MGNLTVKISLEGKDSIQKLQTVFFGGFFFCAICFYMNLSPSVFEGVKKRFP
jgi:hypothetical protein